jgi:phosphomannomutase
MVEELIKIANFLNKKEARCVAISYDGSEEAYVKKNLLEGYILGEGINVVDCDICATNVLSATMKKLEADYGVSIIENDLIIINNEGEIIKVNGEKEYRLKTWKDIGEKEVRDANLIYQREIFKIVNIKNIEKHLILNLNFSPLFKVAPYIFRKIFKKVTTLNATNIKTINGNALTITKNLIKSYNADAAVIFDKYGFSLKILINNEEVSSEQTLERVKNAILNGILKDAELKDMHFDSKLNSIKFTKFSRVYDSILTAVLFFLQ